MHNRIVYNLLMIPLLAITSGVVDRRTTTISSLIPFSTANRKMNGNKIDQRERKPQSAVFNLRSISITCRMLLRALEGTAFFTVKSRLHENDCNKEHAIEDTVVNVRGCAIGSAHPTNVQ